MQLNWLKMKNLVRLSGKFGLNCLSVKVDETVQLW